MLTLDSIVEHASRFVTTEYASLTSVGRARSRGRSRRTGDVDRSHRRRGHRPHLSAEGRTGPPQSEGRVVVLVPGRFGSRAPGHRCDPGSGHGARPGPRRDAVAGTSRRRPTDSRSRSPASPTSCCGGWTGTGPACGSRSRPIRVRWWDDGDLSVAPRTWTAPAGTTAPDSDPPPSGRGAGSWTSKRPERLAPPRRRRDRASRPARAHDGRRRRWPLPLRVGRRGTDTRRVRRRRSCWRRDRRRAGVPLVPHARRGVRRSGEHRARRPCPDDRRRRSCHGRSGARRLGHLQDAVRSGIAMWRAGRALRPRLQTEAARRGVDCRRSTTSASSDPAGRETFGVRHRTFQLGPAVRRRKSSNSGTLNAVSPWAGL